MDKQMTAMGELIELIDEQYEIPSTMPVFATLNIIKIKATKLLEKEKQQIINAVGVNDFGLTGTTTGTDYYNHTFTNQ